MDVTDPKVKACLKCVGIHGLECTPADKMTVLISNQCRNFEPDKDKITQQSCLTFYDDELIFNAVRAMIIAHLLPPEEFDNVSQ